MSITVEILPSEHNPASLFFREKSTAGPVDVPDVERDDKTGTRNKKSLLCRRCRTVITNSSHETAVNGSHLHTFFNPAGVIYEIGCFQQARGCVIHGPPNDEFSWFKGYVWQYAVCIACRDHLGWFFSSDDSIFYGLITDKLIGE